MHIKPEEPVMWMRNRWMWSGYGYGIIPKVIVTFSILYEASFKKKNVL